MQVLELRNLDPQNPQNEDNFIKILLIWCPVINKAFVKSSGRKYYKSIDNFYFYWSTDTMKKCFLNLHSAHSSRVHNIIHLQTQPPPSLSMKMFLPLDQVHAAALCCVYIALCQDRRRRRIGGYQLSRAREARGPLVPPAAASTRSLPRPPPPLTYIQTQSRHWLQHPTLFLLNTYNVHRMCKV